MYALALILHSWLRWGAIVAGLLALLSLLTSPPQRGRSGQADTWGLFFMIALDLQLVLGLLLYFFISPNMAAIFKDFGAAMKDPVARFWAVEHISMMLVAVILAHVGRVLARKATSPAAKRTRLLVCFGLALLAILARTPWPGMPAGRPLFRISAQS